MTLKSNYGVESLSTFITIYSLSQLLNSNLFKGPFSWHFLLEFLLLRFVQITFVIFRRCLIFKVLVLWFLILFLLRVFLLKTLLLSSSWLFVHCNSLRGEVYCSISFSLCQYFLYFFFSFIYDLFFMLCFCYRLRFHTFSVVNLLPLLRCFTIISNPSSFVNAFL